MPACQGRGLRCLRSTTYSDRGTFNVRSTISFFNKNRNYIKKKKNVTNASESVAGRFGRIPSFPFLWRKKKWKVGMRVAPGVAL